MSAPSSAKQQSMVEGGDQKSDSTALGREFTLTLIEQESIRGDETPVIATHVYEFESVFREFAPYVLRVLMHLGVAEKDVEDVCQDVFLAVHRKLADFQGRSSLRTWIYGICIRTASNYRQRACNRRELITDQTPQQMQIEEQWEHLKQKEDRDLLADALNQLSVQQRQVIVLFEIEQLSMVEVVEALGCSKFTAYARLYAARRQMKSHIRRVIATRRTP